MKKYHLKKSEVKGHDEPRRQGFFLVYVFLFSLAIGFLVFAFRKNAYEASLVSVSLLIFSGFYLFVQKRLKRYGEVKKMEEVFPDFVSLVASNLRAGMTIDRALLMSSRKEFDPLDREISKLGKDILTGKQINFALKKLAERIGSEDITKTVQLIVSGIRAGGNLAILLEETAVNMRERIFVKKRAASNVLMYVIFIFFAVAIGAPVLFGLSSVLVEILSGLLMGIPVENANINLPFTLTKINVSTEFIFYFSIVFVLSSAVLSSLIIGLVSKGKEKEGWKYILPLAVVSVSAFLLSRLFLTKYFSEFFG